MGATPTIRSLAKLAGVSKSTVSLALRNNPRIRLAERERIQGLAAEAGYAPNALMANLLAQLRSSKTSAYQSTLGLVYAAEGPAYFRMITTYQEWFAACKTRARRLGYGFDEFSLHEPGMSPARLVRILDARNVRGLVVVGPFPNGVIPAEFDPIWRRSASVVIGVRPVRPTLSCASNDQFSTASQAMRKLRELGYRRPGLCLHPDVDAFVEGRFQGGYTIAQRSLPAADRIPVFDYGHGDKKRFARWAKHHRPDALLTLHQEIKEWVEEIGWRTPEDIGLVHLDRTDDLAPWAGIQQNNHDIGSAAVDMVIGQLHRNELGMPPFQKCVFTIGTWVQGETVRQQQEAAAGRP